MGITGLIKFLEKASSPVHLKDLRGSAVAVDTYCWLHKGVFGCAEQLVRGEHTDRYLRYCLNYIDLLLRYDIKPILVFDGRHLPAKALTEQRRRQKRQESRTSAIELLRAGEIEEARSHMCRCVDVTHEMALHLIRLCRERNVDCIVAPYEADAQMAWLYKVGLVQYVITEDSDLTLFGAGRIIYKLDTNGAGMLVEAEKFYLAMGCKQEKYNFEKFRRMCILSGCDYLDSLPGIGLVKARKFMLMTEEEDMWRALKKIPQYLNMKNLSVDDEYIDKFLKAEATFRHMFIYNPLERRMERLNELSDFQTDERYCCNAGELLESEEQALQLALGNVDPFKLKQLDTWHPDKFNGLAVAPSDKHIKRAKHKSIWQMGYKNALKEGSKEVKTTKSTSCAIFFQNIDFISKTIDEEVTTNEQAERAKPEEAEIFSMYKQEAEDNDEPELKRRRLKDSADEDDLRCASTSIKPLHNPFARKLKIENDTTVGVCENGSLLKVLSPKKMSLEAQRNSTNVKNLHRVKLEFGFVERRVEVKSRFFAANLEQTKTSQTVISERDIAKEIDLIERASQQKAEACAQLYESPSPKKVQTREREATSLSQENEPLDVDEEKSEEADSDTILVLSDNDEVEDNTDKKPETNLEHKFGLNAQPRRLGLPRVKLKRSKKTTKEIVVKPNQTLLHMFGFQKRSILK